MKKLSEIAGTIEKQASEWMEGLLKLAQETDPFWFFDAILVAAEDKKKDHAYERAVERTDSKAEAERAYEHANKIVSRLNKDSWDLLIHLANGSQWSIPCGSGLLAIVEKDPKGHLFHKTMVKEDWVMPRVSGDLERELSKIKRRKEKKELLKRKL